MKKMLPTCLRTVLTSCALLLLCFGVKANHIVGMDMSYQWQSGNTYKIVVTIFGDCGNSVFPSLDTAHPRVCVYNAGTLTATLSLTLEGPGTEITPVCVASLGSTTCTIPASTIPGVKKFVYSTTYTVPTTSQFWRFVFNGNLTGTNAGRSSGIGNISTPGSSVIMLVDTLNNLSVANNSSPNLTVAPTPYFCQSNIDSYAPGAIDADGDSLSFSLIPGKVGTASTTCPATASTTTVTYTSTYTSSAPLGADASSFTLDASTGQISFVPTILSRYLVVYNVREFRGGVLVGTSMREMNFLVNSCSIAPPSGGISSPSPSADLVVTDSTHVQICASTAEPFSFHILPTSSGTGVNIKVTASGLPSGSSFSVINDSTANPDATFSWNTTGLATGSYTFFVNFKDDQCPVSGTNTKAYTITILPLPTVVPISGPTSVCAGSTITLTDTSGSSGGTWSSSTTAVGTVSSGGVVTGISGGTTTITYAVTNTCGVTRVTYVVTVNPVPNTITGTASVCVGFNTTLGETSTGGTWSSSTPSVGTVSTTGVVTGITAGTTTISYTFSTGCTTTRVVSVNTQPSAITPAPTSVCTGFTVTLSSSPTGGAWTSSNTARATVGATTGIVTGVGVTAGTVTITYAIASCISIATVSVNLTPNAITGGSTTICAGTTTTFADATSGGTWSSSNTAAATVNSSGVVTGVAAGNANISYIISTTGCYVIRPVTVNTAPSAISPTAGTVCQGSTITLTDAVTGGTWSSNNTAIASVGATTGIVTGNGVGTAIISYFIGTCFTTAPVIVNTTPAAINPTAATSICVGTTASLSDATSGGTWSSSNTAAATVNSSGVVTGVAPGTANISYILTTGCFAVKPVTVNIAPAAIAPASPVVCAGSTLTLTNSVAGGNWVSSNVAVATIGISSGVATGVAAGTTFITYAVGSCTVSATLSVNPLPVSGTVSGPSTICVGGSPVTFTSTASGGTWSMTNSHATIGSSSGIVTAVSAGLDTVRYSVTNSCGTAVSTATINVLAAPDAGTITGPATLCVGGFSNYTSSVSGGVWSISNASATITSGGVVTAVSAGVDTISYTVTTACGTAVATKIITINALPSVSPISGASTVCVGSNLTLSDATSGGVWSASNTNVTVTGGVVTGVTVGTSIISYSVTNSCGTTVVTKAVTINPLSSAGSITGPSTVCVSSSISLSATVAGGVWSASNGNAIIVSTSGVVTGVFTGLDTMTYTVTGACGLGTATAVISVISLPSAGTVTGPGSVCVGSSITLSDAVVGGTWSASNANATIGSSSGIVAGVTAGTDVITYTLSNSCGTATTVAIVTINPLPDAGSVTGPDSVCIGAAITLADASPGGVWSAGNANATVSAGGVVTGVASGTVPISYSVTNMCGTAVATKVVVVVAPPSAGMLSGPSAVCTGAGITLLSTSPGGVWSASNANAIVSGPGIITGVAVGIDTIFYAVTNLCGTATASKIISVNPTPVVSPITGPTYHCVGSSITLNNATAGGLWTSSNMAVATVGLSTGIVNGLSAGDISITYTFTNSFGCPAFATAPDTVLVAPIVPAITGSGNVCIGATTTLADGVSGGTWTSGNTAIATVGASNGVVSGVATGTAAISYNVTNICGATVITTVVTVNPLPVVSPITGVLHECVGLTTTLSSSPAGGVWSSGNVGIATVGSSTGIVTGVSGGSALIIYTYTDALGCSNNTSAPDTAIALPVVAAIGGATNVCQGATATVTDATASGVWSSSDAAIASIDAAGVVTGIAEGTVTLTYAVTAASGCVGIATTVFTVNIVPPAAPILGSLTVCEGAVTTLTNTTAGGTWSSDDAAIATIDPVTGEAAGVAAGTVVIRYSVVNPCGSVMDSAVLTVNPAPAVAPISAAFPTVCSGGATSMSDVTPGGVWSSSDPSIGTVDAATGLVMAISTGTVEISYTVTSAGCSASAIYILTVAPAIPSIAVLPLTSATLCHGPVNMHVTAAVSGLTYQWQIDGTPIAGATDASYNTDTAGTYSVIVSNGLCTELLSGPVVVPGPNATIGFNPPNILFTGSFLTYQWYINGMPIPGATTSITHIISPGTYKVVVTDVNGCSDTSSPYIVNPSGGGGGGSSAVAGTAMSDEIGIYPNPAGQVLHIDAPGVVDASIHSVDGKLVLSPKHAKDVDVSKLHGGVYLIRIYDQDGVLLKTARFVKSE